MHWAPVWRSPITNGHRPLRVLSGAVEEKGQHLCIGCLKVSETCLMIVDRGTRQNAVRKFRTLVSQEYFKPEWKMSLPLTQMNHWLWILISFSSMLRLAPVQRLSLSLQYWDHCINNIAEFVLQESRLISRTNILGVDRLSFESVSGFDKYLEKTYVTPVTPVLELSRHASSCFLFDTWCQDRVCQLSRNYWQNKKHWATTRNCSIWL